MAMRRLLVLVAFTALVCAGEVEDNEQKKRGAGKTTTLNAIPTGAQKQEYTYIYQSPSAQTNQPSPSYQTQVPNSFYPTQGGSQYYSSNPTESSPQYAPQPQINLIPPPSSSQFVPLNFVPNPGYQAKYQIVPSKSQTGNIQLAILPQPQGLPSPSVVPYQFFSPNPTTQVNPQQHSLQGQYQNLAQNYQLPFSPYLTHPSMFLLAQPNSLYNNLLYQNPVPSFYQNYYPANQAKYNSPSLPPPSQEYEKIQGPVSQSISKEDNDLNVHGTEYITPSDASSYKNAYSASRTSYSKL
ncbi:uncharacterized protein LOC126373415 [Pectinophora gossypiella]|uniref:uncharacterized protein LOC126373415 n=1 Tax=Pectinophora gossypiella TaxID=13191 RepID=UPI00214E04EC|nr:uncharacterized protein LOC126373415 [Pectinophora gossypiella]